MRPERRDRPTPSAEFQGLTDERFVVIRGDREKRAVWRSLIVERAGGLCQRCGKALGRGTVIELVAPLGEGGAWHANNVRVVHSYCTQEHLAKSNSQHAPNN